jgi:hypothetical protein
MQTSPGFQAIFGYQSFILDAADYVHEKLKKQGEHWQSKVGADGESH